MPQAAEIGQNQSMFSSSLTRIAALAGLFLAAFTAIASAAV